MEEDQHPDPTASDNFSQRILDIALQSPFQSNSADSPTAEARTHQDHVLRDLIKSVKQEVHLQKTALSLEIIEIKKGVRAHIAIVMTDLEDIRKEMHAQKSALSQEMDDKLKVENNNNLTSQLSELVDYINRGGDAKKRESGSSRSPQHPLDDRDRFRPGGGGGSRSEPVKRRGSDPSVIRCEQTQHEILQFLVFQMWLQNAPCTSDPRLSDMNNSDLGKAGIGYIRPENSKPSWLKNKLDKEKARAGSKSSAPHQPWRGPKKVKSVWRKEQISSGVPAAGTGTTNVQDVAQTCPIVHRLKSDAQDARTSYQMVSSSNLEQQSQQLESDAEASNANHQLMIDNPYATIHPNIKAEQGANPIGSDLRRNRNHPPEQVIGNIHSPVRICKQFLLIKEPEDLQYS
ncbi:hypothetical protein F511_15356 [Dorcoceras hygrometricum]|uniref:Uncharacterized protein n=1 Tax=Dorcoceras hygrometricum TaxID=472368 RepID=A0A2Z7A847_9LAMI|nr:hypothetical protein F511_15356 [Dorcoceras hygrometricum]